MSRRQPTFVKVVVGSSFLVAADHLYHGIEDGGMHVSRNFAHWAEHSYLGQTLPLGSNLEGTMQQAESEWWWKCIKGNDEDS